MVQYAMRLAALICVFVMSSSFLSAELMLVSVDKKGYVAPLKVSDMSDDMKRDILSTMLKYQWPSNTAYAFSEKLLVDECAKLFNAGSNFDTSYFQSLVHKVKSTMQKLMYSSASYTEIDVIRAALHNKFGKSIDVLFVPTTMYELFVLSYLFQESSQQFMNNAWFVDSVFVDAALSQALSKKGAESKDVFGVYLQFLAYDLLQDTQVDRDSEDYKRFASFREMFFELNEQCIFSLMCSKKMTSAQLSQHIEQEAVRLASKFAKSIIGSVSQSSFVKRFKDFDSSQQSPYNFSYDILQEEFAGNDVLNSAKPLAKMIKLEYQAHKNNRALLFRGTFLLKRLVVQKTTYPSLLDTSLCTDDNSLLFNDDALKSLVPRSVCYGNSLFAGGLIDIGGTVYYYWSKAGCTGYVLDIDKKEYFENKCNDLFYISPLPTLLGIFAYGQFFHSRTKAVVPEEKKYDYATVAGVQHGQCVDYTGLLLTSKNPLTFEKNYSDYLARHMHIVGIENEAGVSESDLQKAHQKLAVCIGH